MNLDLTVVVLFGVKNAWTRIHHASENTFRLSAIAFRLTAISGWLGGKMMYVHGAATETPPESAS